MKHRHIPVLYKYRPCNEFSFSMLAKEMVWFPKPGTFNDPYDMDIKPRKTSPEEYRAFLRWWGGKDGLSGAALERYVDQAFEGNGEIKQEQRLKMERAELGANEMIANTGVLSLSQRNDSVLMWSHYAQEHKGFCVEFSALADNPFGKMALEVTYSNQYPIFSSVDVITKAVGRELFFTKASDWSYEEEWRIVHTEGNIELPFPGKVTSIIFGLKMESEDKERVREILKDKKGIVFKQATKVEGEFNLKIVDLS